MEFQIIYFGIIIYTALWIYSEFNSWLFHRKSQTTKSFQLTSVEEKELRSAERKFNSADQKIKALEKQLRNLEKKGAGLRKNRDGVFDNRSTLGKKLNKSIRSAREEKLRRNNALIEAAKLVIHLEGLEATRALPWIRSESRKISARIFTFLFASISLFTIFLNINLSKTNIGLQIALGLIAFYFTRQYFYRSIRKKLGYI